VLFLAAVVANMSGVFGVIAAVVLVVGALGYFALVYVAAGASAAYLTRLFGRLGKNRNPGVEALASAGAAGLAILVLRWASTVYIDQSAPEPGGLAPEA